MDGWMDGRMDREKGWEKQMVPDREALQGDLDFILGEGRGGPAVRAFSTGEQPDLYFTVKAVTALSMQIG